MSNKTNETIQVPCIECGNNYRHHQVLFEFKKTICDPDDCWEGQTVHQIVQCNGCESVKYREYDVSIDNTDEEGTLLPFNISVYPSAIATPPTRAPLDFGNSYGTSSTVPAPVVKMYRETIYALNSNAVTLAGGGLRATVEAVCLAQGLINGNLQNKIDALVSQKLLTPAQADLLHEERYLGNAALHELATPASQDIEDGLQIVEGLLNTIYVLPVKAKRLRDRREGNNKKKKVAKTSSAKRKTKKS